MATGVIYAFSMGLLAKRILLVTGKGGVGKTTIAAALALAAASAKRRVLCAEVWSDASSPHTQTPLMTALRAGRASESPAPARPGIDAVLLTPTQGQRQFLHQVLPRFLVDAALRAPAIRRFLAAAPALPEMGLMYQLLELLRRRAADGSPLYETCVVDAPATGHALALAQIPALLLEVIPSGRVGATAREGLAVLTDPNSTGVVAVTLPERLPVGETVELCAGLSRHQVPIAAVVANRVPENPFDPVERAAIDSLLQSRAVAGTRLLQRIDAARAALEALGRQLSVQILRVPEVLERSTLVDRAAAALTSAEAG
jgi:arsenite-transporting ATPase